MAVVLHDVMSENGHIKGRSCPRKAIVRRVVLLHDFMSGSGHSAGITLCLGGGAAPLHTYVLGGRTQLNSLKIIWDFICNNKAQCCIKTKESVSVQKDHQSHKKGRGENNVQGW